MSIEVNNESGVVVDEAGLAKLGRFVLDALNIDPLAELSVVLLDVEAMTALHVQWMDLPGPTDVMAFPIGIAAGMARMSYRKFLMWNIMGGIGWVVSMTLGGYYLTEVIRTRLGLAEKDIDKVLLPVIFVIIIISALPAMWHMYSENREVIHREIGKRTGRRTAV